MDLRKLKKLIDLVQESGIAELEITEGEEKVRISRQAAGGAHDHGGPPHAAHGLCHVPRRAGPAARRGAGRPPRPKGHLLKSPDGRHLLPLALAGRASRSSRSASRSTRARPSASSRR